MATMTKVTKLMTGHAVFLTFQLTLFLATARFPLRFLIFLTVLQLQWCIMSVTQFLFEYRHRKPSQLITDYSQHPLNWHLVIQSLRNLLRNPCGPKSVCIMIVPLFLIPKTAYQNIISEYLDSSGQYKRV